LQQQEHAELYKKWRAEVREQEDELQRLADKHVPLEHIDRLKSDWAREYDNMHREKIQSLQSEKDSLRDTLASERKDHELFAAQAQQREIFAARAAQEERDRHAALGLICSFLCFEFSLQFHNFVWCVIQRRRHIRVSCNCKSWPTIRLSTKTSDTLSPETENLKYFYSPSS
jgi:hypothetical protein